MTFQGSLLLNPEDSEAIKSKIKHKINHFKVNNSMAYSTSAVMLPPPLSSSKINSASIKQFLPLPCSL